MKLRWNQLHVQSREEICWGAGVSEKLASKSWEDMEEWLQMLLNVSVERRSKAKLELCG